MLNKKEYYVDNNHFYKLIKDFKNNPDSKKTKNEIGNCLIKIANYLATSFNFFQYPDDIKDEMIQDAVVRMYRKIEVFDINRSDKPFSFFTGIAYNVYRNHLNRLDKRINGFVSTEALDNNAHIVAIDQSYRDLIDSNKVRQTEIKK
jgi:DNA-directed RNA polymerase specialized sigma24 family protein